MDKTLVLWDIDGTLNVHGRGQHWNGEWVTNTVTRAESPTLFASFPAKFETLTLRMNSALMQVFSSLSAPHVEHRWLTAWEHEAVTLFCPKVGFEEGSQWEVITEPEDVPENRWWKTQAVRNLLSSDPELRIIWVDDLIDHDETIENENRQVVLDFPGQVAMVGVMAHQGVTPDVFNFVRRLATEQWQAGMFLFEQ